MVFPKPSAIYKFLACWIRPENYLRLDMLQAITVVLGPLDYLVRWQRQVELFRF
jgi:hypothetical protein